MSEHYQVNTEFTLNHGKPLLKCIIYFSTNSAITTFPVISENSLLKRHRVFKSLLEAKFYINNLMFVYKDKNTTPPIFKYGQLDLFKEL